ncbi:5-methylthioadenosine/S-adenosylhomocysteine deaminase [Anaerolineae bacterium]|nr:5-methylthioadenosine/S-adenosylhomocysteine deaminase [Anaerolineae bacterium]
MLITNGTVITLGSDNRVIENGAVYLRGDKIADIGKTKLLLTNYPDAERLDARGKLIMPGSIVGHTHFYGAFARGMAIPGSAPKNFPQILDQLWWKIDRALTLEDCKLSALVCLVDAIRNGTTTLIDHHASPNAIDGSLDAIADAVIESGLRASLCYEVTDRNGSAGAKAGIKENVRFINKVASGEWRVAKNRLGASFGLHASFTVSDKTLEQCLNASDGLNTGFHIHVGEDISDEDDSLSKYGMRVVDRLHSRGVLGAKSIAVHCVNADIGEIEILRQTNTHVAHNPRSNMNNAVGVADILGMLRRGVNVGLGNDGFSNNHFAEMKIAYLLHKATRRDPRVMGADQVLRMAYANNAKIAQVFWKPRVGELSVGAFADIILLDYIPYTPLTAGNFPWQLIFGIDGAHVTHTICAGKLLMKDRELLTLDEQAIAAKAKDAAVRVWQKVREL